MDAQLDFDFAGIPGAADGLVSWRQARKAQIERLADKMGLPLGRRVRVAFGCGPPLEGLLLLDEEMLFLDVKRDPNLHLRIGNAAFLWNEIASCVSIE